MVVATRVVSWRRIIQGKLELGWVEISSQLTPPDSSFKEIGSPISLPHASSSLPLGRSLSPFIAA